MFNIIQLQHQKQEEEMSDLSERVLSMMRAGRLETLAGAQLLDVVWSVDGRSQRVPRWL